MLIVRIKTELKEILIAETVTVLNTAVESCTTSKKPSKNVPKLKVWNGSIARSLKENREANRK